MNLKNRVAIVTGGSSGIGKGICLEFAKEGAKVVVADISNKPKQGKFFESNQSIPVDKEIKSLGGDSVFINTNISSENDVKNLIDSTIDLYGKIDILVNNAGIHIPGTTQDLSIEDWDKVIGVNLRGQFLTAKNCIPHLKKSKFGRIIQIASIHSFGGGLGPAYPPSKAALINLVKDLAIELAPYDITVNAICPGAIETPIQDYLTKKMIDDYKETIPLGRFGLPKDIAKAAVFFASDQSEWITGTSLTVDGGHTAKV